MELNKKNIELLKECLPELIDKYEQNKDVLWSHEKKEIKILDRKIKGIKDLLNKL